MKLAVQALCHKGLVRDRNEDALSVGGRVLRDASTEITTDISDRGFFFLLVADGQGGHEKGEEASRFTLDEINEQLTFHQISPDRFEEDVQEAARYITFKLNRAASDQGQVYPMGSTLTGVIWHYGKTWLINAGNSRTYRFRGGELSPLTTDDTERGITGNPKAGKGLLNCLGGGAQGRLAVEDLEGRLQEGDKLLICSDGLSDTVSDQQMAAALSAGASAADLFRMACANGGADNISIILARIS